MTRIAFEDFTPGETISYGDKEVTAGEIVAFARRFDPQPFHLDAEAGRRSLLGGLAASGWHNAAMLMRLSCDAWLNEATGLGSPGIEEMRWMRPVLAGDRLSVRRTTLDARALGSRPGIGVVRFEFEVVNHRGEVAMTQRCPIMFALRDAAPPAPGSYDRPPSGERIKLPPPLDPSQLRGLADPASHGVVHTLGTWRPTREEIVAYARDYDPQPFHLDEAAAAASPFGRLSASGWHTAANWMRAMIDAREAVAAALIERGLTPPTPGPSPGFRDLKWLKPVYLGDAITYWTRIDAVRATSRKGWGLATGANGAVNQHGEPVFEFASSVFTPL